MKLNFEKLNFWLNFAQILIFNCPKVLPNASNKPCRLVSEYLSLHKKRLGGSVQSFFLLRIFNSSKISKKQPLSLVFSPKVNFSHTQLPSIALKCHPTITSLPQHTKDGEKTGFIRARYPKWSKIYNFDLLPVLLALMGEPFLKRMAPNFLGWLSRTWKQPTKWISIIQRIEMGKNWS